MAITASGTIVMGTGVTALSITPAAVGNCFVLMVKPGTTSATCSGVSGGNCTWALIAGPFLDTSGTAQNHYLFLGTATATGAATVTATLSAGTADLDTQQFTNGSTATIWALDGTQAGFVNKTTASTTVTWPSLTPAGAGELYAGHSRCPSGGSYSGVTAGFTSQTDADGNPYIYGVISAVSAPTETSTSTPNFSIGALVTATIPGAVTGGKQTIVRQAVKRASLW